MLESISSSTRRIAISRSRKRDPDWRLTLTVSTDHPAAKDHGDDATPVISIQTER
jgi:hypothetical protein